MSEVGTSTWYFPSDITITGASSNVDMKDKGGYFQSQLDRSSSQSCASNSWVTMSWNAETFDIPSGRSASPNPERYTPVEDGLYGIKVWVYYLSSRTDFRITVCEIQRNGTTISYGKRTGDNNANAHYQTNSANHYSPLSTTDYITVRSFQRNTGGAAVNCQAEMQIVRVGGKPT